MTGIKDSKGKTRWSLVPFDALEPVVRVLEFGAKTKYAPDNWKYVKEKASYGDAIIRHWQKYFIENEEFDLESDQSHLAHIICDALFLIWDRQQSTEPFDAYIKKLLQYSDYVTELDENKFK